MIKKIFFVANAESIHTAKWIDYFIDREYDVYVATFTKGNKTKCKNIFYLSSNGVNKHGGNYHYLFKIDALSKLFKKIKPDIVNAHYSYSMGLISLLAIKWAKIDTQFSVVCHGSDILDLPYTFFDKINQYVLRNSDKIFVVSDQIKDKIEEFNIDMQKVFVGQYGIDINATQNVKKDIDILSNRAYNSNSNIDFLLNILEEYNKKDLKIVFVLPLISDLKLNEFKKRYPNIEFYAEVEYQKMIELLNRSRVYISATKSDGTALSLLEAMSLGTIPLVSNIISNRSWIVDSINGYLFNGKDDFLKKLDWILHLDNTKCSEIQTLNSELVDNRANYSKQMKQIEDFIQ